MLQSGEIRKFFNGNIPVPEFDAQIAKSARDLQNQLTKPIGSLGKLEDLAIWMAGWQKK